MIKLDIEEYCETCPHFEVEQSTIATQSIDGEIVNSEHHIKCVNQTKCNNIKNHLENVKTFKIENVSLADVGELDKIINNEAKKHFACRTSRRGRE